jgi:pilus assembly protein FimV
MAQSFDDVEDLTRFADESFDTDEIDLFEFTGDDDSPLTRLKSIILSLDWEISDDILDELAEEIAALSEMWKDDKVAQVYLQGIDKVGKYLRVEGAYAHPNAIKLLLTLFYNYEKIISSSEITGDEITALLKADIRKFKVLQYQIARTKGVATAPAEKTDSAQPSSPEQEGDPLVGLEATILGLDWEVTDEGLERFNRQAEILRDQLADNQHALVLVQGLQAIGAYISDEKASAHPDAFTLMHSFYDGLKTLVNDKEMDVDKRQELIIEHVSSLNTLKEIIAGRISSRPVAVEEKKVDEILEFGDEAEEPAGEAAAESDALALDGEEEPAGVTDTDEFPAGGGDELDFDFGLDEIDEDQPAGREEKPAEDEGAVAALSEDEDFEFELDEDAAAPRVNAAMETADEEYPEDVLDPAAIQPVSDEIADEFIEEELSFTVADTGLDDQSLEVETPAGNIDIEEELELLFTDAEESEEIALDLPDSEGEELELTFEEDETEVEEPAGPDFAEALADAAGGEDDLLDFDQDLFVTEDVEEGPGADESVAPALADADEDDLPRDDFDVAAIGEDSAAELEDKLDSFFGLDEEEETPLQAEEAPLEPEEDFITPALADEDEEGGFREELEAEAVGEEPSDELEDKLDSFFGLDEEEPDIAVEEQDKGLEEEADMETDTVVAALSDVDEDIEGGFREEEAATALAEDPSADIQDKLDSFFGEDDIPAVGGDSEEAAAFPGADDTIPALADADEEEGFSEERVVAALDDTPADITEKLDSFFGEDTEEEKGAPAAPATALAAVAAAAATFAALPSKDSAARIAEIAADGRKEELSDNQLVLLELIDSAARLLADHPEHATDNSEIVSLLAADVENCDQPGVLVAAVGRYTAWQQQMFSRLAAAPAATAAPAGTGEIIDQVSAGFEQLRESIRKEFENLRRELQ